MHFLKKNETGCQHMKRLHSSGFWNFLVIGLALKQQQPKQTQKQKENPQKVNTFF